MSDTVYRFFKEDLEEAYEEGRKEAEEARREAEKIRREYEEWLRKVAIGFLMCGVDPNIVSANTGYSLDELADLMASAV